WFGFDAFPHMTPNAASAPNRTNRYSPPPSMSVGPRASTRRSEMSAARAGGSAARPEARPAAPAAGRGGSGMPAAGAGGGGRGPEPGPAAATSHTIPKRTERFMHHLP